MQERHLQAAKAIERIWVNKDYDLLRNSLAENLKWYERSYDEPLTSRAAVIDQWKKDLAHQEDIKVTIDVLTRQNEKGTYEFDASFKDLSSSKQMNLVGTFYVELDQQGKIALFKQWWMPKTD